jgi:hypothetical protein
MLKLSTEFDPVEAWDLERRTVNSNRDKDFEILLYKAKYYTFTHDNLDYKGSNILDESLKYPCSAVLAESKLMSKAKSFLTKRCKALHQECNSRIRCSFKYDASQDVTEKLLGKHLDLALVFRDPNPTQPILLLTTSHNSPEKLQTSSELDISNSGR